jgi:hypothetical protein
MCLVCHAAVMLRTASLDIWCIARSLCRVHFGPRQGHVIAIAVFVRGSTWQCLSVSVCREWPHEHIAPTKQKPIDHPAKWPKGHKHDRKALERQETIAKNMAKMPQLIAESKVSIHAPTAIVPRSP